MHATCLPISVFVTWSPKWYLMRNTELKAPFCVVFSSPLLPHPSWAQISSSQGIKKKKMGFQLKGIDGQWTGDKIIQLQMSCLRGKFIQMFNFTFNDDCVKYTWLLKV
jgi:hypothetical protein